MSRIMEALIMTLLERLQPKRKPRQRRQRNRRLQIILKIRAAVLQVEKIKNCGRRERRKNQFWQTCRKCRSQRPLCFIGGKLWENRLKETLHRVKEF